MNICRRNLEAIWSSPTFSSIMTYIKCGKSQFSSTIVVLLTHMWEASESWFSNIPGDNISSTYPIANAPKKNLIHTRILISWWMVYSLVKDYKFFTPLCIPALHISSLYSHLIPSQSISQLQNLSFVRLPKYKMIFSISTLINNMSSGGGGSGGYYKYRCKYWLTHECPNWVWVNNASCAHCLVRWLYCSRRPTLIYFTGRRPRVKEAFPCRC